MALSSPKLIPCLFFETEAEEAANFYVSIFPNSSIKTVSRFPETFTAQKDLAGTVMMVDFTLNGYSFSALNTRPTEIKFTEAVSLQIICDTQEEVDHYWDKLSEGGDESKQVCGWLGDKFGVSWQVVPKMVPELMSGADAVKKGRVMMAFMKMKKIIIQDVLDAVEGKAEGGDKA
ncbi:uncharacterized protein Z518_10196 [Rhinocladiella mackenziei CBS 650.93]|uniref:PhnB-like domain-containing protein n=1 Tax=Rhinocladiella mackenziei CBS 650.93 TaxID=1442369 RepID=A0A0D2IWY2_9EURO|nr:uncharacterized protein Z518_10196 [Rhinocladiella mackenziei CBS 650.93]KIX01130.1 hypothetical protein Z518_10196 [Rhinocladiella mackenziei CBS 650.93]